MLLILSNTQSLQSRFLLMFSNMFLNLLIKSVFSAYLSHIEKNILIVPTKKIKKNSDRMNQNSGYHTIKFLVTMIRMFDRFNYKYLICTFLIESIRIPINARFFLKNKASYEKKIILRFRTIFSYRITPFSIKLPVHEYPIYTAF